MAPAGRVGAGTGGGSDSGHAAAGAAAPDTAPDTALAARDAAARAPASATVHTTATHPWLTVERGWVAAGALKPGEHVRTLEGGIATVRAVRPVPGTATMYNLTVSQVHTFAVGADRYVVHNTCGPTGSPSTLRHYTSKSGYDGITKSGRIDASTKALNPKDARAGDGVYLTNLTPAQGLTKGKGQIARRLFGQPFAGHKLDYYLDIDVTGLDVRVVPDGPGTFLIPTTDFVDVVGRLVGGGPMNW